MNIKNLILKLINWPFNKKVASAILYKPCIIDIRKKGDWGG